MTRIRHLVLLGMVLSIGHPTSAQIMLKDPVTFPEPFSRIVGLRELADGRVIVADRLERHVSYIDFTDGSTTQIGREGEGPGEYQQPLGLLPLPNDASLLTDLGNMRLSFIDSHGTIGQTWPMMRQGENGMMSFIRPTATDSAGTIYFAGVGVMVRTPGGRASTPSDSSHVVRMELSTGNTDTVATLFAEPAAAAGARTVRMSRGAAFNMSSSMLRPFQAADGWGVAPDGRVAVVRTSEYRVDWYMPDGTVQVGSSTPYDPVPVRRAEKEQWADSQTRTVVAMAVDGGGGGGSFQVPRPDIDEVDFPDVMPPFDRSGVSVSPSGDVWVRLNQAAGIAEPLFDVFDANGRKVRQVRLPANRELIGFGRGVIYAINVDESDLQWLERYSYP